jgi:3-deoxy-D-manno-octulosonic-acid transferase
VRRFYTLLLYLALPWVSLVVLLRGLREREYWRGWGQRFGAGPAVASDGIWVHAVSVGEVQVAMILIEALRAREPASPITLTCATPTGRTRAATQLSGVAVSYGPYDLPGSVRRFLRRVRPRVLILIETELWPNLLHEAWRAQVPTVIASARVSERSARRYQRLPGLLRMTFQSNVWVGAQTDADAQRFAALGIPASRLSVSGNVKFDRSLPPDLPQRGAALRAHYAAGRPVWVAGSTHAGEEQMVLQAHRQLLQSLPEALLILAPRHPQRFEAVAASIESAGLACVRRSQTSALAPSSPTGTVLLLDTLGELMQFYAASDVAFVGGSLVPVGGHNLLEPAAIGIPVLTGPHQFNSPQVAAVLRELGAAVLVRDSSELAVNLVRLLGDAALRSAQGAAAARAIDANRGALARLLQLLDRARQTRGDVPQ